MSDLLKLYPMLYIIHHSSVKKKSILFKIQKMRR
jgi:hypothetical protein